MRKLRVTVIATGFEEQNITYKPNINKYSIQPEKPSLSSAKYTKRKHHTDFANQQRDLFEKIKKEQEEKAFSIQNTYTSQENLSEEDQLKIKMKIPAYLRKNIDLENIESIDKDCKKIDLYDLEAENEENTNT